MSEQVIHESSFSGTVRHMKGDRCSICDKQDQDKYVLLLQAELRSAKSSIAELNAASPCGQKFADGTPHPMACWRGAALVEGEMGLEHDPPHCLICASEQKLRAEYEQKIVALTDDRTELSMELVALREGLAGLIAKWKKSADAVTWETYARGYDAGLEVCAAELAVLLTPPAASGRDTLPSSGPGGEGQKS
jgi:hypothetical protein